MGSEIERMNSWWIVDTILAIGAEPVKRGVMEFKRSRTHGKR